MVISCSPCQKEEKECIWNKYLIYAVLRDFNFVVVYSLFPPNSNSEIFRVHKEIVFSKSESLLEGHSPLKLTDENKNVPALGDEWHALQTLLSRKYI